MHSDVEHACSPRLVKAYIDRVTATELEKIGLTPSSASFLAKIRHNEGVSLKALSEMLLVDKAHTTRMVTKLIQDGLVENTAEGHQYSLRLTDKGIKVTQMAWKINDTAIQGLYKDLTLDERAALRSIMVKVLDVIRRDENGIKD